MTPMPSRESWWDDLAAMCAAPVARAPHAWLIGTALLALLLGRHDFDAAAGVQIAAGALVGALCVRLGTVRSGAFPLWLVPAATAAAHVLDTPSHFDLGYPLAIATGAFLVWEGVVSQRRLPTPVGVVLVWGGLAAARVQSLGHESLPSQWLHVLDLGWPLAIAAAALMLRGPSREEREDESPRRAGRHAATWLVWGFAPAAIMAFPDPAVLSTSPSWQAPLDLDPAAALLAVAFAVRVADHVVDDAHPDAAARTRVVERIASRPWTASVMLVVLAIAMSVVVDGTVRAMLVLPRGAPVVYSSAATRLAYPDVVVGSYAALAHGPFRRMRGAEAIAPYMAILGVGTVVILAPYVPVLVAEELSLTNIWEFVLRPWLIVLLVPVLMGRFVSERPRSADGVDHLALLVVVLAPPVWLWMERGVASGTVFEIYWGLAMLPVAFLFHRLVACRLRTRTFVVGAALAAGATTIGLLGLDVDPDSPFAPGPGHAPFPSLANPNQLRVFLPIVVGWCAALLPLFFARAIAAASERTSCVSSDRPPGA